MWASVCLEWPDWFLNQSKHLHCLSQANSVISSIINREIQPQEGVTQDPGLCVFKNFCASFKRAKAVALRILEESEIHNSQPEPLPVTPPNIQTQHTSLFYSPLLVSIRWFFQQQGMWGFIQNKKGQDMWLPEGRVWGRGGQGVGDYQMQSNIQRNDKQQSPTESAWKYIQYPVINCNEKE